jgi:DNA-binding IclR family transcriptional regulator
MASATVDPRTAPRIDQLVTRIRAEFLELPCLRLTLSQASRLFGVDRPSCERVLSELVSHRFLKTMGDGSFIRRS